MATFNLETMEANTFPLGRKTDSLYAVGTLAIDHRCEPVRIDEIPNGGKKAFSSKRDFNQIERRYGVRRLTQDPGSSTGAFARQAAAIASFAPEYGKVHLFTTLVPEDPTTAILERALEQAGIVPHITPNLSATANPEALLVPWEQETQVLSYKPSKTPAINVFLPEGENPPGVLFINAAAGKTRQTIENGLEFAEEHNVPVGTIATMSEVELLTKPGYSRIKDAYHRKLRYASFFAGNIAEVQGIIDSTDPSFRIGSDGRTLTQQLRTVFDNSDLTILLTEGKHGSWVLAGDTLYEEAVEPLHSSEYANTIGAGDAKAAAFVQGIRIWGINRGGIMNALPAATRTAESVLAYPDALSGQLTGAQFMDSRPRRYSIKIEDI